jgi:hypothetical protein
MTQLEDRLRAAFREKADKIPPVAPPLQLPQPRRGARPGGIRGLGNWLTPGQRRLAAGLAAAAAVAAIAVGTLVASGPSSPPERPGLAAKPPPYYVAIADTAKTNSDRAVALVRATRTGAVLARIPVPRPYTAFAGVTGAADDRTFVLEAVSFAGSSMPAKFFLLRIDPGARLAAGRTRLTPLGLRLPSGGTGVLAMALSPDGKSLAVVTVHGAMTANRIVIYNLSTRASRSWEDRGCQDNCIIGSIGVPQDETNTISWAADGRHLGFVQETGAVGHPQFRLLNVRAPGDNVLADSQPVTLRPAPGVLRGVDPRDANWGISLITPDGRSIIIDAATPQSNAQPWPPQALLRYSARTGALQAVLGVRPTHPAGYAGQVLWTSSDGGTILVTGFNGSHTAGLLHDGHYFPIPWSPLLVSAAW